MIYYCGAGGNDLNAGTSWATRLATLNACEDAHGGGTPKLAIAAGDTVYVGPGVYRELLICDVSGLAGQMITYIGDITGEHTDGIGGIVRITGSNDDQTAARGSCISLTSFHHRTFRGFTIDTTTSNIITSTDTNNIIIEDCTFQGGTLNSISIAGPSQAAVTIQRCYFLSNGNNGFSIAFTNNATVNNTGHLVQNCIFHNAIGTCGGISDTRIGGITVKNNLFLCCTYGVRMVVTPAAGQTITVNNCLFYGCSVGVNGVVLGDIVENFNNFFLNSANRTNVAVGANSTAYSTLLLLPILNSGVSQVSGFHFPPPVHGDLSQWSLLRAITGSSEPAVDFFGIARPVTAALNSWGPVQFQQITQDVVTVRSGTISQEFTTAGRRQLIIPVQAVNTTVTVYCYREANYAGTAPQMVLKQSGQADITVTDAGAAGVWNQLTHTWIPASVPTWIVIELVSNNTAAAGAFAVYFDDLTVSPLDTDTQEAWLTNEQPVNYAEEATVASAAFSPVGGEIVKG